MMLKQEKQVWNMLSDAFGQEAARSLTWMTICLCILESKPTVRTDDGGRVIYREIPMGCGDYQHFAKNGEIVSGEITTAPCS